MKKLLLLLLLTPLFFGCELYIDDGNIQNNINGNWKIVNIIPVYSEDITIVNDDFYAISPFNVVNVENTQWLLRNDTTNIEYCYFYKIGYQWEFDYNYLMIKDDKGKNLGKYYIGFVYSYYTPSYFQLTSKTTGRPIAGEWLFKAEYATGTMPSNIMYITVPELEFSVDGSERSYDRLITQSITLTLMR